MITASEARLLQEKQTYPDEVLHHSLVQNLECVIASKEKKFNKISRHFTFDKTKPKEVKAMDDLYGAMGYIRTHGYHIKAIQSDIKFDEEPNELRVILVTVKW